jgi:HEAT repeat protein
MRRLIYALGLSLSLSLQTVTGQTPKPPQRANDNVREWLAALERSDVIANEAAYDLKRLGPVTKETTPLLVKILKSGSAEARPYIVNALGELGDQPELSVPVLVEALAGGSVTLRNQAVVALIRTGAPSVPELIRQLERKGTPLYSHRSPDPKERELAGYRVLISDYAAVALIEIGAPAVPALVATFKDSPPAPEDVDLFFSRGNYAAYILAGIGEPAVPALRDTLKNGGRTARVLALVALLKMEERGAEAVPEVAALLEGKDQTLHETVFKTLRAMGPRAVPALMNALRSQNAEVRGEAAEALGGLVEEAPEALPALADLFLNDSESQVRFQAGYALRKGAAQAGEDVIHLLTKGLSSPRLDVRNGAAEALGVVGARARASAPRLRELLRDPNEYTRSHAAIALSQMGQHVTEATSVLVKDFSVLRYEDEKWKALEIAAGSDVTVVPSLVKALTDKDNDEVDKSHAVEVLGNIGPGAEEAVPALAAVAMTDDDLRDEAADALAKIGPAGLPALLEMARSEQEHFRVIAYSAMGKAGRVDEKLIEVLSSAAAEDPEEFGRAVAVTALGELAPLTKKTAPVVIKALGDSSEYVRAAAVSALAGFGPDAVAATPAVINIARANATYRTGPEGQRLEAALAALEAIAAPNEATAEGLLDLLDLFEPPPPARLINALARAGDRTIHALNAALKKPRRNLGRNVHFLISRFGPAARGAVPGLVTLLSEGDRDERVSAATSLHLIGPAAREAWPALVRALSDRREGVRFAAAQALLGTGYDVRTLGLLFNTVINDYLLADFMDAPLKEVSSNVWLRERREGGSEVIAMGSSGLSPASVLPPLPWPPPASSAKGVLPQGFLADAPSLKAALDKTSRALAAVGFDEYGLFETPGGFALVTRVERIRDDGTSHPGPDRWTNRKLPTVDPVEILRQVFIYKPGQWRMFSFVFTTEENFSAGESAPAEEKLRGLHLEGGKVLPEAIGRHPSSGRRCYVLVYRLEKKLGEGVRVKYDDPLSAEKHLRQAGLGAMFN